MLTISELKELKSASNCIAFSPDGNILASGNADSTVKLWNVETGQEITTFSAHCKGIISIAYSPKGDVVATGSVDSVVNFWEATTGELLFSSKIHKYPIYTLAFSPDGKLLVSGSRDDFIQLYDLENYKPLTTLSDPSSFEANSLAFSPNGELLVSANDDGYVTLWDLKNKQIFERKHIHIERVHAVALSPNGQLLASGGEDESVIVWNISTNFKWYDLSGHWSENEYPNFTNYITSVNFSPDGKLLASASFDKTVKIWDVESGKELATIPHEDIVVSAVFSPQGKLLVSVLR